ncbi:MAG: hypothetical protein EBU16_04725 [Actinobacteria bacterium]|jgi:hypothetical protein|nr:hypothetical protein [Actinomycetota bacterium]
MAYSVRRKPENTKEIQYSTRFAKLLTEDMGLNLEAVGFHLVRNHPVIVARRLDVLALTAQEEYDKLMGEYRGDNYGNQFF